MASFSIEWDELTDEIEIEGIEKILLDIEGNATSGSCTNATPLTGNDDEVETNNTVTVASVGFDLSVVTKEALDDFNHIQKNKNTLRKTNSHMRRLNNFMVIRKETREIINIPHRELDELLALFVLSVRKEDGLEYDTTSLRSFTSTFERVLQKDHYPFTISKGSGRQGFPLLRETMASKMKKLKGDGKGNKENAAQPITDSEIEILYEKGLLGSGTPHAIINTLWLKFTIHFGLRGVDEHHNMKWGDVSIKYDGDGTEFLELVERQTKTRTGEHLDSRQVAPRLWSSGDSRDIISVYRLYASKRPHGFSKPDDSFYLAPRTVPLVDHDCQWFLRQRIGVKKLSCLMKTMTQKAGINRKLTNHSARKYTVQKLRDSGTAPTDIMQISGHKNVQSIINYSNISLNAQKQCSSILSNNNQSTISKTVHESHNPESYSRTETTSHSQTSMPAFNLPVQGQNAGYQSLFFGATLNIQTMNVYGNPPTSNQ